jgi:serine/threonine protein kinase
MYDIVRLLCNQPRGAALFVYVNRTTGDEVVVKQARKENTDARGVHEDAILIPSADQPPLAVTLADDSIDQELRVAQTLRSNPHANVVRCFPTPPCLPPHSLVMEYCPRGDLFTLLEEQPQRLFDEADAVRYFRGIVNGVRHLHSLDIAHRDLSLENVLVDAHNQAKICDFGLSARASVLADDCVGKLQYMAPEVVCNKRQYDPVVADVWSLGIMLFIMLTGSPLYTVAVPSDPAWPAMERVGVVGILDSWQMRDRISEDTLALLGDMLRTDPAQRLQTLDDVRARLA